LDGDSAFVPKIPGLVIFSASSQGGVRVVFGTIGALIAPFEASSVRSEFDCAGSAPVDFDDTSGCRCGLPVTGFPFSAC
jgi:hypothetical protein